MSVESAKVIVVGSGLFGLTIARQIASKIGVKVLVLEKRNHIGGNAWSEFDAHTGIEIHKYGTHIFHTSNESVWNFVNQFTNFTSYRHRVWTTFEDKVYPMPINLATISGLYNQSLTPSQAIEKISKEIQHFSHEIENLEQKALNSIGKSLYAAFIEGYTWKQWGLHPSLLPASVVSRLPVRFNFETDYFSDKFQGLPVNGYAHLLKKIAEHDLISIETGIDYFNVRNLINSEAVLIYTGPIDQFFDFKLGHLNWRTLDFETLTLPLDDFQGTAVMNFADRDVPFTRIHEFKHLHPERNYRGNNTIISREYSRAALKGDEPYYPVSTGEDRRKLIGYRALSKTNKRVIFGGRLGSYQYLDMHMAIASALTTFENEVVPLLKTNYPD